MIDYSGRKALIIGLAKSGLASARLLDRLGASTAVTDMKNETELATQIEKLPERTGRFLGGHDGVSLRDYDLAVLSPGVPWDSSLTKAVRDEGIELMSEVELAFTLLDAPVIAVTGSNGKSTTTSIIGRILKFAGERVYVGGNIGAPLAEAVGGDYSWIVAEISSFQLEAVNSFRPTIGLILNITPDHLDRHKDMRTYTALKARLFENQKPGDVLILNADDDIVKNLKPNRDSTVYYYSSSPISGYGAWLEKGRAFARIGETPRFELFTVEELKIKGQHNIENSLAASLAGLAAGVELKKIREAVLSFTGLPHRMELVNEIKGVKYYNDSKATNVEATVKSLFGFNKNVVLIAGGSSKGLGFELILKAVKKSAKGVVLIGETAPEIEKALDLFQPKARAQNMDEAVQIASKWLQPGDTVLLSPGCASFDMFRNFEERGDAFKRAVARLKETA